MRRADQAGVSIIETAIAVAVIMGVLTLVASAWQQVRLFGAGPKIATGIAEYAINLDSLDADELWDYAEVLADTYAGADYETYLRMTLASRAVATGDTATKAEIDWTWTAGTQVPAASRTRCGGYGDDGAEAALGEGMSLAEGERVLVVDICLHSDEKLKITDVWGTRTLYGHQLLALRSTGTAPAEPS